MENRVTHSDPQCCQQSSSQKIQREILHLGSVCKVPLLALSSRLCFFYFWFAFLFFSPKLPFHPICNPKGEFVNWHWTVGYLHRLCHVVVAVWLSLAGSGWALHPMASRMSLRIWYWGREQTCRDANPSDGHSGDSESHWGIFPWRQAEEIWNRDRQEGNRL